MSSLWGPGCATFDINLPGVTHGNLYSAIYFAAAMLSLMAIFVLRHCVSWYLPRGMHFQAAAAPTRFLRRIALRKVLGFKSIGHAVVVLIYVAINLILLFTMLEWPLNLLSDFARRLGWIAVANIALLFFLALKNTPLAFVTEYSYDRLNDLHIIAGYTTIVLSLLHSVLFVVARAQENELCNIIDVPQHPGMVGLAAMGLILVSAIVKLFHYELFYILHIVGAVLVLFGVGVHRPDFSTYSIRAIIFTVAIFVLDHIIRWYRFIANRRYAAVKALDGGGVMITMAKTPRGAEPGKFALLMIGSVKRLQSHPFTIVLTSLVTFIADSRAGFTKKLYERALEQPGLFLKATLDGPYGTTPRWERYDKVVLIAGGTGASFTFAVALNLLQKLETNRTIVEFVWALRDPVKIAWYTEALHTLQSSTLCNVSIYTTNEQSSGTLDIELGTVKENHIAQNSPYRAILQGRPNVHSIITSAVASARPTDRIVIAACGPKSMNDDVRNATADAIEIKGPSVELHIESFAW